MTDRPQLPPHLLLEEIALSIWNDGDGANMPHILEQLRQVWNARGAADLDAVSREIAGWDDRHIVCSFDDDGDGHRDFSRLELTAEGRAALAKILAPQPKGQDQ